MSSSDDEEKRVPSANGKRVTIYEDATEMDSLLPNCVAGMLLLVAIFIIIFQGSFPSHSRFPTDTEDSIDDVGPPVVVKLYPQTRATPNSMPRGASLFPFCFT
jgi:hypothetical protein